MGIASVVSLFSGYGPVIPINATIFLILVNVIHQLKIQIVQWPSEERQYKMQISLYRFGISQGPEK